MKSTVGMRGAAINKKLYRPQFKDIDLDEPGLADLLVDKQTGRLLVQAGDDREAINMKVYPGPATLLFPAATYAAGQLIGSVFRFENLIGRPNAEALIESVVVLDADNQGKAFDIILLSDVPNNSTLTSGSAPAWADFDTPKIIGYLRILGTDYIDIGSSIKLAQKVYPLPVTVTNGSGLNASGSLFAVVIARDAPTYSNNILKNVEIDLFVKQS